MTELNFSTKNFVFDNQMKKSSMKTFHPTFLMWANSQRMKRRLVRTVENGITSTGFDCKCLTDWVGALYHEVIVSFIWFMFFENQAIVVQQSKMNITRLLVYSTWQMRTRANGKTNSCVSRNKWRMWTRIRETVCELEQVNLTWPQIVHSKQEYLDQLHPFHTPETWKFFVCSKFSFVHAKYTFNLSLFCEFYCDIFDAVVITTTFQYLCTGM